MTPIVKIENLSFSYGKDITLDDLNVQFYAGKLSIILGRNGSGKSTLFNIMAGLQKKYDGQVYFNGFERRKIGTGKNRAIRIGFMNQFHQTTFPFTVREVIMTGRASFQNFAPSAADQEEVRLILERFKLLHLIDKSYISLSGGERQLVLLCRVLIQKPDILMLDEPTNHLDLHYQIAVIKCIKELAENGTTVLCVMHDPNLAFMYGDLLYVMQNKKLVDLSTLDNENLQDLLEDTYQLPLVKLDNQGKTIFVPKI